MRIISASRRTDIPAFYIGWLMARLKAGYCHFANPFSRQVHWVSLAPEDVVAIAFWTRNAAPLIEHIPALRDLGYGFCLQYTITGYPEALEEAAPERKVAIAAFRRVSDTLSPQLVQWRYDPIILTNATPAHYHVANFEALCQALEGATTRCYVSFAQPYVKTLRNLRSMEALGLRMIDDCDEQGRAELASSLAQIAAAYGIETHACCSPGLVSDPGATTAPDCPQAASASIVRGSCVDAGLVARMRPDLRLCLKAAPSREGCGCAESTDIGAFDTCLHGCRYCYATSSLATARRRHQAYDSQDTMLCRPSYLTGVDLETVARPLAAPRSRAEGLTEG